MFPEIFGITITQNLDAFGYLNDIMKSLFAVLRNKRSEQLATVADQTAIEIIEMIMEWHQNHQLDDEVLLEICEIFRDNTSMKEQKHGKVRERCCAYFGYILYGLDTTELQAANSNNSNKNGKNSSGNSSLASPTSPLETVNQLNVKDIPQSKIKSDEKKDEKKDDEKDDEKETDKLKKQKSEDGNRKVTIKISKIMRRAYLLESQQFTGYMSAALEKATADKEEHVKCHF